MASWDTEKSQQFWNGRQFIAITQNENLDTRIQEKLIQKQHRETLDNEKKEKFMGEYNTSFSNDQTLTLPSQTVSNNIKFWIEHLSWSYCNNCKLLRTERMLPNYSKRQKLRFSRGCLCKNGLYLNPTIEMFPELLRNLTLHDVIALRPLDIHLGDYVRKKNGYRQKNGMFHLTWSKKTIEEKISEIADTSSRTKCSLIFQYLMASEHSSYKHFVELRCKSMPQKHFNVYDFTMNTGVECCLWPHLYPTSDFCDTTVIKKSGKASSKIAFMTKVFSQVLDYGTNFELLQFHYDFWLFRTVSGAITTAQRFHSTPAQSLAGKAFSPEFWKWQHLALIDAVQQLGYPSLFITISPSEWSFPLPPWLLKLQEYSGLYETELPAFETMHFVNVLEQIVRGYLCGSNDKSWKSHLFSYQRNNNVANVLNYFYRFEFQKRGTVHIHILVWLKSMKHIDLKQIRANIPWGDADSAYLVHKLQKSEKSTLPICENDTNVTTENCTPILNIHHPAEAFEINLRAYIASLLPALQCHMDVQAADGHGMLLKYVSSYVSKSQDAYHSQCLYSPHTTSYQAAYRHLKEMRPLEPEMWMSLSSKKIAWTPHRIKKMALPLPDNVESNKTITKYWARPTSMQHLSLLQWLRTVNTTKAEQPLYKNGLTFVATKTTSVFKDEYFFQDVLLNVPHNEIHQLHVPNFASLPNIIKYFVCALHHRACIWQNENNIRAHFEKEGHKSWFITNIAMHIQSLKDVLHLWKKQVLSFANVTMPTSMDYPLDSKQQLVVTLFTEMANNRNSYYATCNSQYENDNAESDEEINNDFPTIHEDTQTQNTGVDWKKFLLVVGRAGTGKSYALNKVIEKALLLHMKVFVATPTGFLATGYKDQFQGDVDSDTIHSAFHYPVKSNEKARFNWSLGTYDLLIIDELSMVPIKIFDHIFATISELPIRPIVLLAGDDQQLQPIECVEGKIQTTATIMTTQKLSNVTIKILLTEQHRNNDSDYSTFLQHIRLCRPSQKQLDKIQFGKILFQQEPTNAQLIEVVTNFYESTVITVSRKAANRINNVVLTSVLKNSPLLGHVVCDCELGKIPVYKGMKVMITQNRNKEHSIVNGRIGNVIQIESNTVFLKFRNGNIGHIYPVTTQTENGTLKTVVPFMPAYALTIPKAQGQTLSSCVIWLDSTIVAPGGAYVALSRCKKLKDITFMVPITPSQITPVMLT